MWKRFHSPSLPSWSKWPKTKIFIAVILSQPKVILVERPNASDQPSKCTQSVSFTLGTELLYNIQSVPRSKHTPSRLYKEVS